MDNKNNAIIDSKAKEKTFSLTSYLMEIQKNNYQPDLDIYYTKYPNNRTTAQQDRAKLLFELYPEIEQTYGLTNKLRAIHNQLTPKEVAITKLTYQFNQVENTNLKQFNTVTKTFMLHCADIEPLQ